MFTKISVEKCSMLDSKAAYSKPKTTIANYGYAESMTLQIRCVYNPKSTGYSYTACHLFLDTNL